MFCSVSYMTRKRKRDSSSHANRFPCSIDPKLKNKYLQSMDKIIIPQYIVCMKLACSLDGPCLLLLFVFFSDTFVKQQPIKTNFLYTVILSQTTTHTHRYEQHAHLMLTVVGSF